MQSTPEEQRRAIVARRAKQVQQAKQTKLAETSRARSARAGEVRARRNKLQNHEVVKQQVEVDAQIQQKQAIADRHRQLQRNQHDDVVRKRNKTPPAGMNGTPRGGAVGEQRSPTSPRSPRAAAASPPKEGASRSRASASPRQKKEAVLYARLMQCGMHRVQLPDNQVEFDASLIPTVSPNSVQWK